MIVFQSMTCLNPTKPFQLHSLSNGFVILTGGYALNHSAAVHWLQAGLRMYIISYEPHRVFLGIRHKLGCTATEGGLWLEITDLGSWGHVLSLYYLCSEGKTADQLSGYRASYLRGYRAADLQLHFRTKNRVSHDAAHIISVIPELTNKGMVAMIFVLSPSISPGHT